MTRNAPRPTPYARGQMTARNTTGTAARPSLKGLPYGPGPRQDDFIKGFRDELAHLNHKAPSSNRREAA